MPADDDLPGRIEDLERELEHLGTVLEHANARLSSLETIIAQLFGEQAVTHKRLLILEGIGLKHTKAIIWFMAGLLVVSLANLALSFAMPAALVFRRLWQLIIG